MSITLSPAFTDELKKGANSPNIILEVELDSGTVKWGYSTGGFSDVLPILKSVSSLQNKLNTKSGYSSRGQLSLVITGRENFTSLIQGEYLKNRRVTRKDGFVGLDYSDYAATFTGTVLDWSRKGDQLTLIITDDLYKATKKIPEENATKTQKIDYRATNPVDIMQDILKNKLGIPASYVDDSQFDSEQSTWLSSLVFDRVLTKPEDANRYLNELQIETNSFIVHDGEKISFKVFAPPVPGQTVEEWTGDHYILKDSFSQKSGYKDNFFNRVVIYYDYDESGNGKPENFEAAYIAVDASSQSSIQWDETRTKTINSKWIRTRTYTQPSNITGVTLFHVSRANSTGDGTLDFTQATNALTWTAPGGTAGESVTLSKDGKFTLYDADKTKWVRVVVDTSTLPGSNQTDTITISALNGDTFAATLANKLLSRYRDPVSTVNFDIDINNVVYNSTFRKPTDLIDLTTDEACDRDRNTWSRERVLITSLRPDFTAAKVKVEAIQTRLYRKYGFIAPSGYPDYGSATEAQKVYGFIRNAAIQYYIW